MSISARFEADFESFKVEAAKANAALTQIEATSHNVSSAVGEMGTMAEAAAGAFGIAFSIGAVVNFGREVLAAASELEKLHAETGLTVEGLQRLQAVGDETSTTLETITNAIVKMENKLAGADPSAVSALTKLGLSFADIKTLSPEQQFIAISDAIRQISDPSEQVNVAIALFGKAGAQVLPTLKKGFDDVRDGSVGMSADTVVALKAVDDAMTRAWRTAKGDFATAFSFAFLGMTEHVRDAAALAKQIDDVGIKAATAAPLMKGLAVPGLPADLEAINAGFAKDAAALEKFGTAMAELNAVGVGWRGTLDTIDGSVVEAIKYYLDAGVSQEKLATAYGLTAAQIKAVASARTADMDTLKLYAELDKTTFDLAMEHQKQWRTEQADRAKIATGAIIAERDAQIQLNAEWGVDASGALVMAKTALDTYNDGLKALEVTRERALAQGVVIVSQDKQKQVLLDAYLASVNGGIGAMGALGAATVASSASQVAAIKGVTQSLNAEIDAAFAAAAAVPGAILAAVGSRAPSLADPGFSSPGDLGGGLHPLRDSGGPVTAGKSYLIGGGQAPELFTPGANGFITPNGGGGGGTVVNVAITLAALTGVNDARVAEQLRQTVEKVVIDTLKTRAHLGSA